MKFNSTRIVSLFVVIALGAGLAACGTTTSSSQEDTSVSGSVAAAVGGGVSGSTSGGSMSRLEGLGILDRMLAWASPVSDALASTVCGVFGGSSTTITYSNCSFSGSSAVWNGSATFTVSGSNVTRLVASGTTRTAPTGTVITINSGAVGAFATIFGTSPPSITGTTYSTSSLSIGGVTLNAANSGGTTLFKHLITTNGGSVTSSGGSWSGIVYTYHEIAAVKATSTLTGLTFSSGCCLPTGGSISTTFTTSYTGALAKYNGTTETLNFTGCGTATYTGPEGYSGSVSLNHCL